MAAAAFQVQAKPGWMSPADQGKGTSLD